MGSVKACGFGRKQGMLVQEIYSDFAEGSDGYRDYGFSDQIRKAGISIMNHIAEGFER